MTTCKERQNYFPRNEDAMRGDCVRRLTDEQQSYYTARPITEASPCDGCPDYVKKSGKAQAQ